MQEQRLGDRLEQMDKEIAKWAKVTRKDLLFKIASLNLQERVRLDDEIRLRRSIKSRLRKADGEIEKVAFSFARKGVFLERGVGRGRPVGSSQANAAARPWLSTVLPDAIESLADLLSEEYADIAAAEIKLNIPGIINTKISR